MLGAIVQNARSPWRHIPRRREVLDSAPARYAGMRRLLIRIAAAIAIFVALGALRLNSHFPALPNPLTIDVGLELGEAGRSDPLIVAGRTGTGDFLSVRFLGPDTFHFLYDSWGFPGISSAPVTFKPSEKLRLS